MRTPKPKRKPNRTELSDVAGDPSTSAFSTIVELLVEHRVMLDAWEHVLKETNPLLHERYLGAIKDVRAHEGAKLKTMIADKLNSQLDES